MRKNWVGVFCGLSVAMLATTAIGQGYTVNSLSTSPVIDGVISPGEWDGAAATATIGDEYNSSFQAAWDSEAIYFLVTNDYTGHLTAIGEGYAWDAEVNWNFYIDPNRDGEDLDAREGAGEPDGYQIAVHTYEGEYSCQPCSDPANRAAGNPGTNIGTYSEAHIDTNWGNQAAWEFGLVDTSIHMINDNTNGGVSEVRIPWTDLNAPGGDTGDTGLNLEGTAPVDGEVWSFNFAYVYPGEANFTPIWQGGTPFAAPPHGRLTFAGGAVGMACDLDGDGDCDGADADMVADGAGSDGMNQWLADAGAVAGDLNIDGTVDSSDLGLLLNNFGGMDGAAASYTGGDINNDGMADSSDLGLLLNNFGSAPGAQSVPEPSGFALALLLSLGLIARYRVRK